jgi:hypothetical protein
LGVVVPMPVCALTKLTKSKIDNMKRIFFMN